MRKEVAMAYCEAASQQLPGRTEENYKTLSQESQPVLRPEPRTRHECYPLNHNVYVLT